MKEEQKFSLRKRVSSSNHALRGIGIFFKTTHNAQAYVFFVFVLLYLGLTLRISAIEWVALLITTSLVFATEAINTALEIFLDHSHPEIHPNIRNVKDVAAGAVMMTIILGGLTGMIIFLPKVWALFY